MPTFKETLQSEPWMSGAFDNYNEFYQQNNQIDGKSSINHIVTAYLLKKDKPYYIPINTIMISPGGTRFYVVEC